MEAFEHASVAFRKLNPELFGEGVQKGLPKMEEKDLQAACEKWLELRGYSRRSHKGILGGDKPKRGWFVHIVKAKGNPLMLDVLVMDLQGRFLEVELKTATGRVQPFQKVLVEQLGFAGALVRSLDDFARVVAEWEVMGSEDYKPRMNTDASRRVEWGERDEA